MGFNSGFTGLILKEGGRSDIAAVIIRKVIESFIYPTDAQLDCSKNVKIYIKIYMRGAPFM